MGYVALEAATRESRLASGEARWRALVDRNPDLRPAVLLQERLVNLLVDLLDVLERGAVPRLTLPRRYLAAKLERGLPIIAGEPVTVPVASIKPVLLKLCRALEEGGAGDAANHVAGAIFEGSIDAASLLSASLFRNREAILIGATHRGLSPDLVWLVGELAVSPFAYLIQKTVLGPKDKETAALLDPWRHGYCPVCGSWPTFAEVNEGRRLLRCSFCALAWTLPHDGCPYCASEPPAFHALDVQGVGAGQLVHACTTCSGYVKVIEVAEPSPFPLLAITDLETIDLDLAAAEAGYTRPELREFAPPGP